MLTSSDLGARHALLAGALAVSVLLAGCGGGGSGGGSSSSVASANFVFKSQFGALGSGSGQFNAPSAIALDSSGNIYVSDYANNRVEVFNNAGAYQTSFGNTGTVNTGKLLNPYGIAVDKNGKVYVADAGNNRVATFSNGGNYTYTYAGQVGTPGSAPGNLNTPEAVAVDSNLNVYVADTYNNRVEVFNSSATYKFQVGAPGIGNGQFSLPQGVAVDGAGNIYVADAAAENPGNGRVEVFDSGANYKATFGSAGTSSGTFANPHAVVIDAAGNIYVTDTVNSRVLVFTGSAYTYTYKGVIGSVGTGNGNLYDPLGVAVDSAAPSNIYVVDTGNNRVEIYSQSM